MRRADRLFQIIHALRGRRTALPARRLADMLEVSLRTVYRDVADLQRSGVPIEGEAGVGYVLRKGADVPPLMFRPEELEALVVGARFARAFAGVRLAAGAATAMRKIEAVLPEALRARAEHTRIFAPVFEDRHQRDFAQVIDRLHAAIDARQALRLCYCNLAEQPSTRVVEPLCLAFWGGKWTLGAWCRMRGDFRNFRLDRISVIDDAGENFEDDPARGLRAYLTAVSRRPHAPG
ncbi:helix-turn-helix transcriptional regulator [Oleiagrimonas soli]|uniref:DeoR faimly transcriptional regulator n=1 Tax=Oleiagrimonas soli TaxID=1543381 RepID=A0A099D028_9GAMM|nr:YafY family protein [Oleiagrimonas soli]KGI79202.1 DeoR faimly transcriptional regulator [Oleiagrimonas soli]MBB6184818.1 putative DNA-binding transcriptional regulator YafY [Oleiagrimonas soli]